MSVRIGLTFRCRRKTGGFARIGLVLTLWLGLSAATVSGRIHGWLHADASSLNHACVLTLLSKGQLAVGAVVEPIPLPPALALERAVQLGSQWLPAVDRRVSPSRAPPACFPL
jgi:hypothetical protein